MVEIIESWFPQFMNKDMQKMTPAQKKSKTGESYLKPMECIKKHVGR
jgi:hypothetical protein